MKLSEIVRYKTYLDNLVPGELDSACRSVTAPIINEVNQNTIQFPVIVKGLMDVQDEIFNASKNFYDHIDAIKKILNEKIKELEPIYLANSYNLYEEMAHDNPYYVMIHRRFVLSQEMNDYVRDRIQMYSNWQRIAAVLRPGIETWIDHIVGCDPLYVLDTSHVMFEPIKKRFHESYINRLRFYVIPESDQPGVLQELPDGQFDFFLAYNFFHSKPFDVFKNYLTEIWNKLAPGGCVALTFNDCDRWGAIELTERNYLCYTPGKMVRGMCEALGYNIINNVVLNAAVTWLEIQKPGKRSSLKGGQALAEVIAKSK